MKILIERQGKNGVITPEEIEADRVHKQDDGTLAAWRTKPEKAGQEECIAMFAPGFWAAWRVTT